MSAPLVPRLLLAAATPSADYGSILGDLHEEYEKRLRCGGRADADRWYWSQALRSIPPLLSYSRTYGSLRQHLTTGAAVLGVLIAMLAGKDLLDRLVDAVRPAIALPAWLYFVLNWMVAAVFGVFLAQVVRHHPVRLALIASFVLVVSFATPIALTLSPQLSTPAWILLLGAIPAMSVGAATLQAFRKR